MRKKQINLDSDTAPHPPHSPDLTFPNYHFLLLQKIIILATDRTIVTMFYDYLLRATALSLTSGRNESMTWSTGETLR